MSDNREIARGLLSTDPFLPCDHLALDYPLCKMCQKPGQCLAVVDLAAALDAATERGRGELKERVREIVEDGGEDIHRYQGLCSDPSQPDARDPECRGCRILDLVLPARAAIAAIPAPPAGESERG